MPCPPTSSAPYFRSQGWITTSALSARSIGYRRSSTSLVVLIVVSSTCPQRAAHRSWASRRRAGRERLPPPAPCRWLGPVASDWLARSSAVLAGGGCPVSRPDGGDHAGSCAGLRSGWVVCSIEEAGVRSRRLAGRLVRAAAGHGRLRAALGSAGSSPAGPALPSSVRRAARAGARPRRPRRGIGTTAGSARARAGTVGGRGVGGRSSSGGEGGSRRGGTARRRRSPCRLRGCRRRRRSRARTGCGSGCALRRASRRG